MNTAHKTTEEKKEHFDSPEELDLKITQLAEWIKESKHFVCFTGAGCSTSTGICDYRSGINTKVPTGPGAWEKLAQKLPKSEVAKFNRCGMLNALPSPCHMALVQLIKTGKLKHIISQNVDGLHRRSGVPVDYISELHGNTNLEKCKKCQKKVLRDYKVRNAKAVKNHDTGRKCPSCSGGLQDTIVNFGENLPEKELDRGFKESEKADLHLILGSSLRVTPAANMPVETHRGGGRVVIVNLQSTPLDNIGFRINGFIDDVMIRLMKKLGIEIPKFNLMRNLAIKKVPGSGIEVAGIDEQGDQFSFIKQVTVEFQKDKKKAISKLEPFKISDKAYDYNKEKIVVTLGFYGNYGEPNYSFPVDLASFPSQKVFSIGFDPVAKKWVTI